MGKLKIIALKNLSKLPKKPGVYVFGAKKEILYLGKAADIRQRVKNHFQQPNYRDKLFLDKIKNIGYIKTKSEIEALILEAELIKKYLPKYNVLWKDDKKYFFIAKTKEEFPRIFLTHQPRKEVKKITYIGPFVEGRPLKDALKALRKIFPHRTCKTVQKKPCLWYYLGMCPGPCALNSPLTEQLPMTGKKVKKECQQNAKAIMDIFSGKKERLVKKLEKRMKEEAKKREYRLALKTKNQFEALKLVFLHAKVLRNMELEKREDWPIIKKSLEELFGKEIERIEAYDISNIQGKQASGSMVVFEKGLPSKDDYRKFKIKMKNEPNDTAMMKEVIQRRLGHPEWPFPDLILVDGGKPQLGAAKQAILEHKSRKKLAIFVSALAKRRNELFLENRKIPVLLEKQKKEAKSLILWIRDQSHQFAKKYHHKLREIDLKSKL